MVNEMHSNDNVLKTIRHRLPGLNPALKKIGQVILEAPDKIKLMRIRDLAQECQVAESTVTRFVQAIDFTSFQSLKIALAGISTNKIEETTSTNKLVYDEITKEDTIEEIINKITYKNIEAMEYIAELISTSEIRRAVTAIEKAEMLVFYCVGYAHVAAENAALRFYKVGKPCLIYSDPAQQAVSAALLTKKNLVIGISNSGKTPPTVNCLKIAKEKGVTTMCITNSVDSPIVAFSDIKFFTSAEFSEFQMESMVARICQCLVLDILYASYAVTFFDDATKNIQNSVKCYRKFIKAFGDM